MTTEESPPKTISLAEMVDPLAELSNMILVQKDVISDIERRMLGGEKGVSQELVAARKELQRLIASVPEAESLSRRRGAQRVLGDSNSAIQRQRRGLEARYKDLGPEYEIMIDGLMVLVERRELLRKDPAADPDELFKIQDRVQRGIMDLQKHNSSLRDQFVEAARMEAVESVLIIAERVLHNYPALVDELLAALSEAELIQIAKSARRVVRKRWKR